MAETEICQRRFDKELAEISNMKSREAEVFRV
jgi:hypothetical protein